MIVGPCFVCKGDVESMHPHAYRVVGWEAVRGRGGANAIIDRQRLGQVAHTHCVKSRADRRRRGIHDEQQELTT